MDFSQIQLSAVEVEAAKVRRLEAMHLQVIEGNPLDSQQTTMFEMFEREAWTHEHRLDHILQLYTLRAAKAAE